MESIRLRVRAVLEQHLDVVLVTLLVCAAVGGWITYGAYAVTETHTEQRTVEQWSVEGSFTHRSTVRESANTTVFEPGETVSNRTTYFQRIMPVLRGQFVLETRGTDAPVDVHVRQQLVVRSVEPRSDEKKPLVYWQQTRPLGEKTVTLSSTRRAAVPYRVNVSDRMRMARNVSSRLGSPGRVEMRIRAIVTATPQDAPARRRTTTFALPIEMDSTIYLPQPKPRTETFTRTETVTVPTKPGPLGAFGGPALVVAALVGAVGLSGARLRGLISLSETEREWLRYRDNRVDFDDWITTIRLPDDRKTGSVAEANTLTDLVEFAIDTDNGVIHDPDDGAYYVVHDGTVYTYRPPPERDR
ncbi:MAG: DUF5305 domain-containing protein [Haloarculaceae archaeon]